MALKAEETWTRDKKLNIGNISVLVKAHEITESGAFARQKVRFDTKFGDETEGLNPVEPGRYRLIWSPGCPWSTRQMITMKLLGLDSVISVGKVAPNKSQNGWVFELNIDGKDPVLGALCLPEIYLNTDPEYTGRATVPCLVDIKTKKVANNDYHNMTNYFETVWKPYHKEGAPDLYPEELREEIDAMNLILFRDINNGVYKAGFSENQEHYEKYFKIVYERLDWLEERLSENRFLFGDILTDSDVRLYTTLARFDIAYFYNFYLNGKRIKDYPNLWNYTRELFSFRAFRESTDFDTIKRGYLLRVPEENPYNILPLGPDLSGWYKPNNRSEKFGELKYRL